MSEWGITIIKGPMFERNLKKCYAYLNRRVREMLDDEEARKELKAYTRENTKGLEGIRDE